jgi:anhydro-N-acetylmuramic acid kinase
VTAALYVGLMSGTSLDGIDAILADLSGAAPKILARAHQSFDATLRAELLALNTPGANELERAALAANALARGYAATVTQLLAAARVEPRAVTAMGCHGQTVRHRPERGYTSQLVNGALLAELTGIRVVCDFRSRDVAAGGQGAPLAPALHAAVFAHPSEARAVLNLGGIANLTLLPPGGAVLGFDTGPGNCLMDHWASRHLGQPWDQGGAWAAGAQAIPPLLERLLAEPYFSRLPPKSTGRDLFNPGWLESRLKGGEEPRAVQATLLELTARTVATALAREAGGSVARIIVCGGGAQNAALLNRLADLLSPAQVGSSAGYGIDPQLVEATAFAWLAQQAVEGKPGNLPAVTGARGPRVLGGIYPP